MELFWIGFTFAASPGPDFSLMTKNTLTYGRHIGYITLVGNRLSLIIHMSFSVLGLSLILQKSTLIFFCIKVLGASYLIYLGFCNISGKYKGKHQKNNNIDKTEILGSLQAFQMGFLSNFLNPKVSLFFLGIFPQFIEAEQLATEPLKVALIFFLGNCLWYVPVLFVFGTHTIRSTVLRFQMVLKWVFGFLFVLYGLLIIWEEIQLLLKYD